ncbi:MAG: stage V sporulation protein AD [Thermaerobacter sp.]|nr:stage V sporulation protein AD [Thermaerobacter sp.]
MSATQIALAGRGHLAFKQPPVLTSWATVAGKKETEGPLGRHFDRIVRDETMGEKSYERAERKLFTGAVDLLLSVAGRHASDVDLLFAGDLLDQIVTANFAARDIGIPLVGVYGACSTSSEALLLSAMAVASGSVRRAIAATASHHLSAERQYRYPIELGVQRLPTAQWTATGAAAFLVEDPAERESPSAPAKGDGATLRIVSATVGRVQDYGLKDPNNMGAAMAPAAADTILRHLQGSGRSVEDFELILTGDLGRVGHPLLEELLAEERVHPRERLQDAGILLYRDDQKVDAGGSGAACSALVLGAMALPRLRRGEMHRMLLVATGSLHSPRTYQQGESIPTIAHAVEVEAVR